MLFQFQLTLAIFVAALIGLALPHYTYQISADDFLWRVMAGFPIAVGGLQMVFQHVGLEHQLDDHTPLVDLLGHQHHHRLGQ